MLKLFYCSLLTLLFMGCWSQDDDLNIKENERFYVSGTIVDENNVRLSGIDVQLENGISPEVGTVLGESSSNNNGFFEFISLISGGLHTLKINKTADSLLTQVHVVGFGDRDNLFIANTKVLRNAAYLDINLIDIDNVNTIFYTIEKSSPICQTTFEGSDEEDLDLDVALNCYGTEISGEIRINPGNEALTTRIKSIKGTTVTFSYKFLIDDNFTTVEIPLNNAQNTYVLEY